MPYTYISWTNLRTQLAARLGDPSKVFWVDTELSVLLKEALRTFGLASGFWRSRGTLPTVSGTAFYDICTSLSDGSENILAYSVTDRDIVQSIQYHLLESATSQSTWGGTEMFTVNDMKYVIQNRLNQFMSDTGCVVNRSVVTVASPPIGRQQLADNIIDVRRAAWLGASPLDYYNVLWREDERMLTAGNQGWSINASTPEAYSIMAPPPLQLQLAPIPLASGQLELLTVDTGPTLDPENANTILGIPDDLTPAIKWGALADLLGKDGIASDPIRASFCERRYQQYVQLARMLPVVIHSEINGVPLIASTLQELEASTPTWENIQKTPQDVVLAAPNLIALNPVPDSVYSITLDVVRRTPIPASDSAFVQVGREQLDMILDYAEHLALFKVAGAEWHATERQAQNFLIQTLTYNQRLSAAARASFSAADQSQRQKQAIPRRLNGIGVGAMRGAPNA